jgi:hypothetical protein
VSTNYVFPAFRCVDGRGIERNPEWKSEETETTGGGVQVDTWWAAPRWSFKLPIVVRDGVTVSAPGQPWNGYTETAALVWFFTTHKGTTESFLYNDALLGQKRVRWATNMPNFRNLAVGVYSVSVELQEDI